MATTLLFQSKNSECFLSSRDSTGLISSTDEGGTIEFWVSIVSLENNSDLPNIIWLLSLPNRLRIGYDFRNNVICCHWNDLVQHNILSHPLRSADNPPALPQHQPWYHLSFRIIKEELHNHIQICQNAKPLTKQLESPIPEYFSIKPLYSDTCEEVFRIKGSPSVQFCLSGVRIWRSTVAIKTLLRWKYRVLSEKHEDIMSLVAAWQLNSGASTMSKLFDESFNHRNLNANEISWVTMPVNPVVAPAFKHTNSSNSPVTATYLRHSKKSDCVEFTVELEAAGNKTSGTPESSASTLASSFAVFVIDICNTKLGTNRDRFRASVAELCARLTPDSVISVVTSSFDHHHGNFWKVAMKPTVFCQDTRMRMMNVIDILLDSTEGAGVNDSNFLHGIELGIKILADSSKWTEGDVGHDNVFSILVLTTRNFDVLDKRKIDGVDVDAIDLGWSNVQQKYSAASYCIFFGQCDKENDGLDSSVLDHAILDTVALDATSRSADSNIIEWVLSKVLVNIQTIICYHVGIIVSSESTEVSQTRITTSQGCEVTHESPSELKISIGMLRAGEKRCVSGTFVLRKRRSMTLPSVTVDLGVEYTTSPIPKLWYRNWNQIQRDKTIVDHQMVNERLALLHECHGIEELRDLRLQNQTETAVKKMESYELLLDQRLTERKDFYNRTERVVNHAEITHIKEELATLTDFLFAQEERLSSYFSTTHQGIAEPLEVELGNATDAISDFQRKTQLRLKSRKTLPDVEERIAEFKDEITEAINIDSHSSTYLQAEATHLFSPRFEVLFLPRWSKAYTERVDALWESYYNQLAIPQKKFDFMLDVVKEQAVRKVEDEFTIRKLQHLHCTRNARLRRLTEVQDQGPLIQNYSKKHLAYIVASHHTSYLKEYLIHPQSIASSSNNVARVQAAFGSRSVKNATLSLIQELRFGSVLRNTAMEPVCRKVFDGSMVLWTTEERCLYSSDGVQDAADDSISNIIVVLSSNALYGNKQLKDLLVHARRRKKHVLHFQLEEITTDAEYYEKNVRRYCDEELRTFEKWKEYFDLVQDFLPPPLNEKFIQLNNFTCKNCVSSEQRYYCVGCVRSQSPTLLSEIAASLDSLPVAVVAEQENVTINQRRMQQILSDLKDMQFRTNSHLSSAAATASTHMKETFEKTHVRCYTDLVPLLNFEQECEAEKISKQNEIGLEIATYRSRAKFLEINVLSLLAKEDYEIALMQMEDLTILLLSRLDKAQDLNGRNLADTECVQIIKSLEDLIKTQVPDAIQQLNNVLKQKLIEFEAKVEIEYCSSVIAHLETVLQSRMDNLDIIIKDVKEQQVLYINAAREEAKELHTVLHPPFQEISSSNSDYNVGFLAMVMAETKMTEEGFKRAIAESVTKESQMECARVFNLKVLQEQQDFIELRRPKFKEISESPKLLQSDLSLLNQWNAMLKRVEFTQADYYEKTLRYYATKSYFEFFRTYAQLQRDYWYTAANKVLSSTKAGLFDAMAEEEEVYIQRESHESNVRQNQDELLSLKNQQRTMQGQVELLQEAQARMRNQSQAIQLNLTHCRKNQSRAHKMSLHETKKLWKTLENSDQGTLKSLFNFLQDMDTDHDVIEKELASLTTLVERKQSEVDNLETSRLGVVYTHILVCQRKTNYHSSVHRLYNIVRKWEKERIEVLSSSEAFTNEKPFLDGANLEDVGDSITVTSIEEGSIGFEIEKSQRYLSSLKGEVRVLNQMLQNGEIMTTSYIKEMQRGIEALEILGHRLSNYKEKSLKNPDGGVSASIRMMEPEYHHEHHLNLKLKWELTRLGKVKKRLESSATDLVNLIKSKDKEILELKARKNRISQPTTGKSNSDTTEKPFLVLTQICLNACTAWHKSISEEKLSSENDLLDEDSDVKNLRSSMHQARRKLEFATREWTECQKLPDEIVTFTLMTPYSALVESAERKKGLAEMIVTQLYRFLELDCPVSVLEILPTYISEGAAGWSQIKLRLEAADPKTNVEAIASDIALVDFDECLGIKLYGKKKPVVRSAKKRLDFQNAVAGLEEIESEYVEADLAFRDHKALMLSYDHCLQMCESVTEGFNHLVYLYEADSIIKYPTMKIDCKKDLDLATSSVSLLSELNECKIALETSRAGDVRIPFASNYGEQMLGAILPISYIRKILDTSPVQLLLTKYKFTLTFTHFISKWFIKYKLKKDRRIAYEKELQVVNQILHKREDERDILKFLEELYSLNTTEDALFTLIQRARQDSKLPPVLKLLLSIYSILPARFDRRTLLVLKRGVFTNQCLHPTLSTFIPPGHALLKELNSFHIACSNTLSIIPTPHEPLIKRVLSNSVELSVSSESERSKESIMQQQNDYVVTFETLRLSKSNIKWHVHSVHRSKNALVLTGLVPQHLYLCRKRVSDSDYRSSVCSDSVFFYTKSEKHDII